VTDFWIQLLSFGGVGILAVCAIWSTAKLWFALQDRENKHDLDRNEWISSYRELLASYNDLVKTTTINQERILKLLDDLEKSQQNLYNMIRDLSAKF
jgi:hypothetical protein